MTFSATGAPRRDADRPPGLLRRAAAALGGRTLRASLLCLTAATLLPMFVAAIAGGVLLVRHEREVAQRSAQERVRALLSAVDVHLHSDAVALRALARAVATAADRGDAREQLVAATLAEQPHWLRVDIDARPLQARRTAADAAAGAGAARMPSAPVSPIGPRPGEGRPGYQVQAVAPAWGSGAPVILTAEVDPEPLRRLLAAQRMPLGGAATILDARQHIVARSSQHAEHVGRPATPGARTLIQRQRTGHVRGRTVDGHAVDTFFDTSPTTGWSVAVGMPAATIDASAWSMLAGAAALLALGTAGAFAAAHVGGRRIARPIARLAERARRLGTEGPAPDAADVASTAADMPLAELRALGDDIDQAARALRRAEAERSAALQREHDLRLQAEDESRSKDRLLATLAHELRNPLSAIRLSTAVLRRRPPAEPTARCIDVIDRQAGHLVRLVDDLLDAARIREGKIALDRRPLRLDSVVRDTIAALEDRLRDHRVTHDLQPVEIDGDETRLAQVVFNLVGNAARYTPPGGRIEVTLARDGDHAVLRVRDEGEGIAPEMLPRLFGLYAQAHDGHRGGLGIGLALVRTLVGLHGGAVTAESPGPGRGATFTVRLPVTPQAVSSA